MLDKNCIKFLKYLLIMEKIKFFEFFNYFSVNKINYELAKNYQKYLFKEGYIKLVRNDFIVPTFKTKIFFKYNEESKFNKIFVTHFLPYIQQFVIFILGLIAPYLLKILKYIAKYFELF